MTVKPDLSNIGLSEARNLFATLYVVI